MITIVMSLNKKFLQYRHETDTWKRYLHFIQQENNHLKNRLSQVLQHDTDEEFLERAEYFQSKFIAEDDTVNMLRQDIHEIDQMLLKEKAEDSSLIKELQKIHTVTYHCYWLIVVCLGLWEHP